MNYSIDINCDMGEEMGNEADIIPYISSVNISCGWHAGNEDIIRHTMQLAKQFDVAIGAHPSFADRENFGRKPQLLTPNETYRLITEQLILMKRLAAAESVSLHHVKPHGALYNMAAKDATVAAAIARAVKDFDSRLLLYGLSGSLSLKMAEEMGLGTVAEVFADRRYQPDGSLVPRTEDNAVLTDTTVIVKQALSLAMEGKVLCQGNSYLRLAADTICLHGDTEGAVETAKKMATAFQAYNIIVRPYDGKQNS